MNLEYRRPLIDMDHDRAIMSAPWKPVDFPVSKLAQMAAYYDVQIRDAETKERINLRDLPGITTNGGQICDVTNGPCNCGAWH